MKKLLQILLLASALAAVLCISAAAADEPITAGLYNIQSAKVTLAPKLADATTETIAATSPATGFENFYPNAAKFDVTYSDGNIEANEEYLLLVCSGTGTPSEDNIVYINQATSVEDSVTFTNAYPSTLKKGDYRIFVVGEHSAFDAAQPSATFTSYEPYKLGDANGDEIINVDDAVTILKYIVGNENLAETRQAAADANEDNVVNVDDAVTILKYIVGNGTLGKQS